MCVGSECGAAQIEAPCGWDLENSDTLSPCWKWYAPVFFPGQNSCFFFSFCHVNNRQLLPPSDIISLHSIYIYIYIPLNDAVMFLQTDVSFSPYAGSVGRSLRDAEEELGALRRQRPVWRILRGPGVRDSETHRNQVQNFNCTRREIWSQRSGDEDMERHGRRACLWGEFKDSLKQKLWLVCFYLFFSYCFARDCLYKL